MVFEKLRFSVAVKEKYKRENRQTSNFVMSKFIDLFLSLRNVVFVLFQAEQYPFLNVALQPPQRCIHVFKMENKFFFQIFVEAQSRVKL